MPFSSFGGGVQRGGHDENSPQGRPIVFIHGASQCWLQWSRQMNSGLAADHRLVALAQVQLMANTGHAAFWDDASGFNE